MLFRSSYFPKRWNWTNVLGSMPFEPSTIPSVGIDLIQRPETVVVADAFLSVPGIQAWLPKSHPVFGKSPDDAYRHPVRKYLKPQDRIIGECERLAATHFQSNPSTAFTFAGLTRSLRIKSCQIQTRLALTHWNGSTRALKSWF